MGKPNDGDADDRQQADSITNGAEQVYTGPDTGFNGDAVTLYLIKQGVPLPQAQTLAASLRGGAQDDLGIQGSAVAGVAEQEVGRMRALSRYLELEKRQAAGGQIDRRDQAFVAAVRDRHRQLIQQRAYAVSAQQQMQRQQDQRTLQAGHRKEMAAIEGQQLERVGEREQNRLNTMGAYAANPQSRQMSADGQHGTYVLPGAVTGQAITPEIGQLIMQKAMAQAKTAAAISQQLGIPPDAAAQLSTQLHAMPTPAPQDSGSQSQLGRGPGAGGPLTGNGMAMGILGGGF